MNLRLGNKCALALAANHQTLGLQRANGLADGGAGDGKRLAEFGFGGQKITGNQNPCGNMALMIATSWLYSGTSLSRESFAFKIRLLVELM